MEVVNSSNLSTQVRKSSGDKLAQSSALSSNEVKSSRLPLSERRRFEVSGLDEVEAEKDNGGRNECKNKERFECFSPMTTFDNFASLEKDPGVKCSEQDFSSVEPGESHFKSQCYSGNQENKREVSIVQRAKLLTKNERSPLRKLSTILESAQGEIQRQQSFNQQQFALNIQPVTDPNNLGNYDPEVNKSALNTEAIPPSRNYDYPFPARRAVRGASLDLADGVDTPPSKLSVLTRQRTAVLQKKPSIALLGISELSEKSVPETESKQSPGLTSNRDRTSQHLTVSPLKARERLQSKLIESEENISVQNSNQNGVDNRKPSSFTFNFQPNSIIPINSEESKRKSHSQSRPIKICSIENLGILDQNLVEASILSPRRVTTPKAVDHPDMHQSEVFNFLSSPPKPEGPLPDNLHLANIALANPAALLQEAQAEHAFLTQRLNLLDKKILHLVDVFGLKDLVKVEETKDKHNIENRKQNKVVPTKPRSRENIRISRPSGLTLKKRGSPVRTDAQGTPQKFQFLQPLDSKAKKQMVDKATETVALKPEFAHNRIFSTICTESSSKDFDYMQNVLFDSIPSQGSNKLKRAHSQNKTSTSRSSVYHNDSRTYFHSNKYFEHNSNQQQYTSRRAEASSQGHYKLQIRSTTTPRSTSVTGTNNKLAQVDFPTVAQKRQVIWFPASLSKRLKTQPPQTDPRECTSSHPHKPSPTPKPSIAKILRSLQSKTHLSTNNHNN